MSDEAIPPKPHADNVFKQQKLQSFFPQFTALTMTLLLLGVAVVFIPIGAAIVVSSDAIQEIDVRYDQIKKCTPLSSAYGAYSFSFNGGTVSQGCNTKIVVSVAKTMSAPVYLYYRLKNFHQNYRQYQISHDDAQLQGGSDAPITDCKPFKYPGEINSASGTADGVPYASYNYNPCGSIAWSMFNDSIALYKVTSNAAIDTTSLALPSNVDVVCVGKDFSAAGVSLNAANLCSKKGIALSADVDVRYKTPTITSNTWSNQGKVGSNDPYLAAGYYAFEPGHKLPVPTDEDFMVWARTASMPDFWKLYRVINTDIAAGDYLFDIEEHFDVTSFDGEKHVVLATRAWIGGKNYALGIILIVVGCFSFVLAVAALVVKLTSSSNAE